RKILCLISGILTLVATYIFAWFVVDIAGTDYYGHGIGVIMSLSNTFANAVTIAASWEVPTFAIYIVGGCLIFFLFSGIIILLGLKYRVFSIIGAIMPILIAIAVISGPFNAPPNLIDYISLFSSESLGGFPLNLTIGPSAFGASVSLGNYLLLAGGILGIVSGFLPKE
ncbi:MAG: hypothetical protein ACFE78_06215, partial [Candidatus Hodarchaeota archaeon]